MKKSQRGMLAAIMRKIGKRSMVQTSGNKGWPVCPHGVIYQPERPAHAPGMKPDAEQKSER